VYYDPEQMRVIGVDMSAFVMAHEEAHVRLAHQPPVNAGDSLLTRGLDRNAFPGRPSIRATPGSPLSAARRRPAA